MNEEGTSILNLNADMEFKTLLDTLEAMKNKGELESYESEPISIKDSVGSLGCLL